MKMKYNQQQLSRHLFWVIVILCLWSFSGISAKSYEPKDDIIIANCEGISTWSATATYVGGNRVSYNGMLYEAKWWNQNRNPETYSGRDDEWRNLGTCDGGDSNILPTITISSPSSGSTFSEGNTITVTANASDADGIITKVEFFNNNTLLGEDTSAPFSFTINNLTVGNYTLNAKAFDNDEASQISSPVTITVESSGGDGGNCDTASYVDGASYATGDIVQNFGKEYECLVGGWCSIGGVYTPGGSADWAWPSAWKELGTCDVNPPDNQSPVVEITQPFNGETFEIGQSVIITAAASDPDGSISKVEFFVDGNKIEEQTATPYTANWTAVTGNHTLTVRATDDKGSASDSNPITISVGDVLPPDTGLPARILNGYWHNFQNGSGLIRLRDVSSNWDVINVSFAEPKISSTDGELGFELAPEFSTINYTENDFKSDIQFLKGIGKKVIISIGGAEGQVRLNTISSRDKFVNSMISIIEEYDFDGMDIDFEGQSLSLDLGDTDFRNPTTPVLVNTINAVKSVCNHFGDNFILTMAPETFFVQLGYSFYGGISQGADRRAGAYLPLIHALRDKLTFLQVQYYNSGSITALDDRFYSMGNADFYVSLVDMLLKGFPITGDNSKFFPALRSDQILIGVPATVNAGNGYTGSQGVINALDYIIKGNSFGGQYSLSQTYPKLRGVMSWSINWDQFGSFAFSNPVREYLDGLESRQITTSIQSKALLYPNPLQDRLQMQFDAKASVEYTLEMYNHIGVKVFEYIGVQTDKRASSQIPGIDTLESGIYIYKIKVADKSYSGKIIKE
ncbi:Ig-like domain-containing protein [uncultured Aquimarina sp.]|uniref:Ig-like domain-containing protein n=1 Tax=uncultured Aquimarina sp. TaxID=575652 RepID=UPI00262B208C|nr:Ig-like domain-containing protein [uncultured Aquimarina sp.]